MKLDQLIIPIGEVKFIEVHKIEWVDIQKIPHKFYPVREVSSATVTKEVEVLKTKRSLFRTKIIKVKDEVTTPIPLVVLDEVLSYDYSIRFRDEEKKFYDHYFIDAIGEHYRELNGSTELTYDHEIKGYKQGSALEKLKSYLSDVLIGVEYKLFEYEDGLRLKAGPHIRVQFNDDQVAVFRYKTNEELMRKANDLSEHCDLLRFY